MHRSSSVVELFYQQAPAHVKLFRALSSKSLARNSIRFNCVLKLATFQFISCLYRFAAILITFLSSEGCLDFQVNFKFMAGLMVTLIVLATGIVYSSGRIELQRLARD